MKWKTGILIISLPCYNCHNLMFLQSMQFLDQLLGQISHCLWCLSLPFHSTLRGCNTLSSDFSFPTHAWWTSLCLPHFSSPHYPHHQSPHPCFSLEVATDLRIEGEKIPEKVFLFCSSEQVIVCFASTLCCCERMLKRVFPYAKSLKLPNTSLGKPANIIFAEI